MDPSCKNCFFSQYIGVINSLKLYFKSYGGFKNFIKSPYLHFSVLLSFASYPIWAYKSSSSWFDLILSILPNILGFTLGGYAILLAFGDDQFKRILAGKDEDGEASPFMKLNGSFIHFIIVQGFSILFALIGKAWDLSMGVIGFCGFCSLIYSIFTAIAAAMSVLNVADWFDLYKSYSSDQEDPPSQ